MIRAFLTLALLLFPWAVRAQTTAQQVLPGYYQTSGCPGNVPVCWQSSGSSGGSTTLSSTTPVTITSSSTLVYTGGTAVNGVVRLHAQDTNTPGTYAYCNFGGAAATTNNSETVPAGKDLWFGPLTNSIYCIAPSGTVVIVVTQ